MTLLRTSFLNGIAVIVRMMTLLGINKILAIYVGPSGYAALGQFQNAVQMITVFASGAINTGVTKYTAEYHEDESKQYQVWRTAGSITLGGSLLASLVIAVFYKELAAYFLKDPEFEGVFLWFAATLVFFTLNAYFLSILNGRKEVARYVTANIAGSLFALAVTTLMAMNMGLYGALVALAIYQSLTFFVTLSICCKTKWFEFKNLFGQIDRQVAKNLSKFALMALASAICVPISHIVIRNYLADKFGWDMAGYWEAMWRLSSAYLLMVTTTLSLYYLPKLSELVGGDALKKEISHGYKIILPLVICCGLLIYLLRDFIISVLFTSDFLPMRELFAWQMIGDTLKIGGWVLAYLMLGKAMFKMFVVAEILFSVLFVVLTRVFTEQWGWQGVTIAHAVNYLLYWLFVWFATYSLLNEKVKVEE